MEAIFEDVRHRLSGKIAARIRIAPFLSNGVVRRLAITVDAWLHQGEINHVTGDIHFAVLLLQRSRTILTVHDCGFLNGPRGLKRSLLKLIWLDLPVQRAALVTTVSANAKTEIVNLTGCDPLKVHVIPNAISDLFTYSAKDFNTACPRLLHLGTAPNKNLSRLVEALGGVRCRLIIIGELDDPICAKLNAFGVEYENYSNLSGLEVLQQYQLCDVLTFVSSYEGFGMPILEANAVGRPVVTSNVSSMPEVSQDAACLVDPFDVRSIRAGILKVCEDSEYRERIVQNGLLNAKRFHPDQVANRYFEVYQIVARG